MSQLEKSLSRLIVRREGDACGSDDPFPAIESRPDDFHSVPKVVSRAAAEALFRGLDEKGSRGSESAADDYPFRGENLNERREPESDEVAGPSDRFDGRGISALCIRNDLAYDAAFATLG